MRTIKLPELGRTAYDERVNGWG